MIAKDDVVDIIVDLPERLIRLVKIGINVRVTVGEQELSGKIITVVPKGDVATRTFPVKIRMPNTLSLIEGMTARVKLPTGKAVQTLIVPRDAVIPVFGRTVVFAVIDSKARMIPVNIIGYAGLIIGVAAQGLKDGMMVVIKGNERLRDGQMVLVDKQG
jgi:multidrug efflux pump subunit AcrA (membrane-fusion protein)